MSEDGLGAERRDADRYLYEFVEIVDDEIILNIPEMLAERHV